MNGSPAQIVVNVQQTASFWAQLAPYVGALVALVVLVVTLTVSKRREISRDRRERVDANRRELRQVCRQLISSADTARFNAGLVLEGGALESHGQEAINARIVSFQEQGVQTSSLLVEARALASANEKVATILAACESRLHDLGTIMRMYVTAANGAYLRTSSESAVEDHRKKANAGARELWKATEALERAVVEHLAPTIVVEAQSSREKWKELP